MNVAILKDNICVDAAVFSGLATAKGFFSAGVWPNADGVAELPAGYGIWDSFDGGVWIKRKTEAIDAEDGTQE